MRRRAIPSADEHEYVRPPTLSGSQKAGRWAIFCSFALASVVLMFWLRERDIFLTRPARLWIRRPLLIVGSMASGTQQMSKELNKLGLRIGHESSSAHGGSVSWIHGLRLLSDPAGPDIEAFCSKPEAKSWHPMMLEPGHCQADGQVGGWGRCWKETCPTVLSRQYGCNIREDGRCVPKYNKVLLQVRHPLKTVASCIRGFCDGGDANASTGRLLRPARGMLPSEPWDEQTTCGGKFALFWVAYYKALREQVDRWYRVEDTSPCKVLALAGLLDDTEAGENAQYRKACAAELDQLLAEGEVAGDAPNDDDSTLSTAQAAAHGHGYYGRHNTDGFALTYEDVERMAGVAVRIQLEGLAHAFGYES
jgi:hypothetical protein